MKRCNPTHNGGCGKLKEETDFYPKNNYCKDCFNRRKRERRAKERQQSQDVRKDMNSVLMMKW